MLPEVGIGDERFRSLLPDKFHRVSEPELVEQTVWFSLRGMGVKEKAIARYYNPKALALFQ